MVLQKIFFAMYLEHLAFVIIRAGWKVTIYRKRFNIENNVEKIII